MSKRLWNVFYRMLPVSLLETAYNQNDRLYCIVFSRL